MGQKRDRPRWRRAAAFARRLTSPALGLIWDPGNAFHLGENPYPDGYEEIKRHVGLDRVVHVHLKDARLDRATGKRRTVAVGEGDIEWAGQLAALARDGYRCYVSLETHWIPPAGTPEEGSERRMEAIRDLLARLGLLEEASLRR